MRHRRLKPNESGRRMGVMPNCVSLKIFLLLAIFFSRPAGAASDEIPLQHVPTLNTPSGIAIVGRNECIAALRPVFSPEEVIAEGLATLGASGASFRKPDCMDYLLASLEQEAEINIAVANPLKLIIPPTLSEGKIMDGNEIEMKIVCYNPHDLGTAEQKSYAKDYHSHCIGKWLKKDAYAMLKEKKLSFQREEFKAKAISGALSAFVSALENSDKATVKAEEEAALLAECVNPFAAGTGEAASFTADNLSRCGGQLPTAAAASESEAALIKRKAEAELDLHFKKVYFSELLEKEPSAPLVQTVLQTNCFGPKSPDPWKNAEQDSRVALVCGPEGMRSGRYPDNFPIIREAMNAAMPDFGRWREGKMAEMAKAQSMYAAKNQNATSAYALKKLMSLYAAEKKANPYGVTEETFCAAFEQSQKKEAAYAAYLKTPFRPFHGAEWAFAQKYGLSEAEFDLLRRYTANDYKVMNDRLRQLAEKKAAPLESDLLLSEVARSALKKLPAYQAGPVYRFANLPKNLMQQHAVGKIVSYGAFTSTSSNKDFLWPGRNSFVIYGANGRIADDVSNSPGEKEVLFRPGTKFKVLSKRPFGSEGINFQDAVEEKFQFVLAEVDDEGNILADLYFQP